jgi:ribosomal protein L30
MRTYPEGIRFCSIDGRDLHEVDQDPLIGEVVEGRYKILKALGLRHHQAVVVLQDSPALRGQIKRVRHLVEVTPVEE